MGFDVFELVRWFKIELYLIDYVGKILIVVYLG